MRLFPRVKTDLPITIETKFTKWDAKITNLCINVVFVKGRLPNTKIGESDG